jgi:hypothetical protein
LYPHYHCQILYLFRMHFQLWRTLTLPSFFCLCSRLGSL